MSDSKAKYSSGVAAQKALAQLDSALKKKLEAAADRTAKYHANWQAVNLNNFVDRFAPGSTAEIRGSKIVFRAAGSNIEVICDVRGGYCRLLDTSNTTKHNYLDIDGNFVSFNKTMPSGKQTDRSHAEYNAMTHFRILKREEM